MRRAWPLLGALLVGWVATWLGLGLFLGNPTVMLHPGSPEWARIVYIGVLYVWLLASTAVCWRRYGPTLRFGSAAHFLGLLALGLLFTGFHRAVLAWLGAWSPPSPGPLWIALLTSPLLAWTEELVFRGYLYSVVREEHGRPAALVGVNAFFALVHLFRPGPLAFKLAYGFGLWLAGVVLSLLLDRYSLAAAAGMHTSWILAGVLDPPGRVRPGLLAGLGGDPAAGLVGWLLLAGLAWLVERRGETSLTAPNHVQKGPGAPTAKEAACPTNQ